MYEQDSDSDIAERIIQYLHNDISDSELKKLIQWLEESPENKASFFQLKNIHDDLTGQVHLSEEMMEESWQRMERKIEISTIQHTEKHIFMKSLKYIAIVAAAAVLGFIIGRDYFTMPETPASSQQSTAVSYHEIHIPKGGKPGDILLADGTQIQLNVAGTLRYPTSFSGADREVFLEGEARFDVAKDENKPFIVHLQNQTIKVYGTSFNVEAYGDESVHKVTLLSGSISLKTLDNEGKSISQIYLKPGQQANFDIASGMVSVEAVDTLAFNHLNQGEYKFKDEALANIVRRIEKYYDVNIHVADELKDIRYTGTLSFNQHIDHVMSIINYDLHFKYRRNENTIFIEKSSNN